jgi:hypothetical protein
VTFLKTYWLQIKLALIATLAVGLFSAGWLVRGWKAESDEAREQRIVQRAIDAFRDHEKAVATQLENKLASLEANQKVVEVEREKVVLRPVYRNICLDADGLRLIEQARTGRAHSSKPTDQVPAKPESPRGR